MKKKILIGEILVFIFIVIILIIIFIIQHNKIKFSKIDADSF